MTAKRAVWIDIGEEFKRVCPSANESGAILPGGLLPTELREFLRDLPDNLSVDELQERFMANYLKRMIG